MLYYFIGGLGLKKRTTGWTADFDQELENTLQPMSDFEEKFFQESGPRIGISSRGIHTQLEPDSSETLAQKADHLEGTRRMMSSPSRKIDNNNNNDSRSSQYLRQRKSARELFHSLMLDSHETELLEISENMT